MNKKPKLNKDGTIRGIRIDNPYSHEEVRKILKRYGKVTTAQYDSHRILYRVNEDDAVLIDNSTGWVYAKYSIRREDIIKRGIVD